MLKASQWWTLILITTDKVTAAGYKAIFLSVDVPVLGQRLNEHKNKFELPEGLEWPNLTAVGEGLEYGKDHNPFLPDDY